MKKEAQKISEKIFQIVFTDKTIAEKYESCFFQAKIIGNIFKMFYRQK
jgi:hypothetical protein